MPPNSMRLKPIIFWIKKQNQRRQIGQEGDNTWENQIIKTQQYNRVRKERKKNLMEISSP